MFDEAHIRSVYENTLLKVPPLLPKYDIQLEYILESIPSDTSAALLDAGCGNGNYARYLANLGYKNIAAVDLFDEIQTDGLFQYKKARINDLPFEADTFDFIFSNSVIHYLCEPSEAFREFYRVLKPNGFIIITAHTKYSIYTLSRIIKRFLKLKSSKHLKGLYFYSAQQYNSMCEQSGFSVLWIDGYRCSTIFTRMARKISRSLGMADDSGNRKHVNSGKTAAIMRSIFSYHSILIAQKSD